MRYFEMSILCAVAVGCGTKDAGTNRASEILSTTTCAETQLVDGTGQCRDLCDDEGTCPDGMACHVATGLCLEAEESETGDNDSEPASGDCADTSDCDFGSRCESGTCVSMAGDVVATCAADADCGPLMSCQLGVCVGCIDDLQCGPDATCVLGACLVGQLGTAAQCLTTECPEGSRCNPTSGQCEPTCEDDSDCASGDLCAPLLQRCVRNPSCAHDSDCNGLTCTLPFGASEGLCTGCALAALSGLPDPCPQGLACVIDACLPAMGQVAANCDPACGEGELCDAMGSSCYPEDGSCTEDDDCRDGHTCNFIGLCSGCAVDGDCRAGQRCLFATCAPF